MRKKEFTAPTVEEIEARRKMYKEAEEIGIDLLAFDSIKKENPPEKKSERLLFYWEQEKVYQKN